MTFRHILFDWGNTLMEDLPGMRGPMVGWPQVQAVEGAVETLAAIAAQWPCHIATNANESTEEEIRQALQRVGLDHYISGIFCYGNLGLKKPDARFFSTICERLEAGADELLMVGDSLQNDVQGAINANLQSIWLNRDGLPCPTGIIAITKLTELPARLGLAQAAQPSPTNQTR